MSHSAARQYRRRRSPSKENKVAKKEGEPEKTFLGGVASEAFFQPSPLINRKAAGNNIYLKPARKSKFISNYIGWVVGINTYGKEVKVIREVGSEDGYPEKLQAVSMCRMANAEPAAVVEDYYGMWHAFEVTENCYSGFSSIRDFSPPNGKVYGLPSSVYIESERQNDPRSKLYSSLVLGTDEQDILFNISSASKKTGKVNFNQELATTVNAPLGISGPETWGDNFAAGQTYAIELATNLLDTPQKASGVLFHEASHLNDYKYAQYWVLKYQQETGRPFIGSTSAPFKQWIWAQAPKRLSFADAELVDYISFNNTAPSEARAHTHTMLAALQAGAPEIAKSEVQSYVTKVAMPPTGSYVAAELTAEIKSAFKKLPPVIQTNLKDIIALAKSKNPDAWISQITFN